MCNSVCMHIYICMHVCTCTYVRSYISTYVVCTYVRMYVCVYQSICIHIDAKICKAYICVCKYACMHICSALFECVHVWICVQGCMTVDSFDVCMYVSVCFVHHSPWTMEFWGKTNICCYSRCSRYLLVRVSCCWVHGVQHAVAPC